MRKLAADGRTVFVSSHLMSETARTADHLIMIGEGGLIADTSVGEQSGRVRPGLEAFPASAQNRPREAAKSLRARFNDSLEVMSAGDNGRPGAEPAIEARGRRPRRGRIDARNASMAVAGESEPGRGHRAPGELKEMTT